MTAQQLDWALSHYRRIQQIKHDLPVLVNQSHQHWQTQLAVVSAEADLARKAISAVEATYRTAILNGAANSNEVHLWYMFHQASISYGKCTWICFKYYTATQKFSAIQNILHIDGFEFQQDVQSYYELVRRLDDPAVNTSHVWTQVIIRSLLVLN